MSLETFALTTPRLVLRDFAESDKDDVFAFRSDSNTTELMDFPAQTRQESDDWVETVIFHNSQRPRESFNIAITLKKDGSAIGWIGFGDSSRNSGPGNFGVGYMFHSDHWGNGYTTEAIGAVAEYIFETLEGKSICAWCWADNIGSARVLEKSGFDLIRRFNSINPKTDEPVECLEFESKRKNRPNMIERTRKSGC